MRLRLLLLLSLCLPPSWVAAQWIPLGPEGGDVRSLAYDPRNPHRIYLGTSAGQLYLSDDSGASWTRFARLGDGNDYVLDNIAVDPTDSNVIYVAAWSVENNHGDLFRTRNRGRTWQTLPPLGGKSIRALALAPSDPKIVVVGTLDGVFRSWDGGETWDRISPAGHREIKNIESIAVDPRRPEVIYAGTWHLPWKTTDGGRTWSSIKRGIIDDSDVFSIIIDPANPQTVYASACSGIYKSESGGEEFRKIQGIPSSARRTRVLQQDPLNPLIVYAGTTEGLWKTSDGGRIWSRITAANVIVNDVLVDPRQPSRVLIATDRSGVLASNDAGQHFFASNRGFSHRKVTALLADRRHSGTLYAGVVNDKEFGGIFLTRDWGASWQQLNTGLRGHDVFTLAQADDGVILAGTNRGIFAYSAAEDSWRGMNLVLREKSVPARTLWVKGKKQVITRTEWNKSELKARVAQLATAPSRWYAATSEGLFLSLDQGRSWTGGPVLGKQNFVALDVANAGQHVLAATRDAIFGSRDGGNNWVQAHLPDYVTVIQCAALAPRALWITSREGAFFSKDDGTTWEHIVVGVPGRNLTCINYDSEGKRLLGITTTNEVFESRDDGASWVRTAEPGWMIRGLSIAGKRLLAITAFDGVVAQPTAEAQAERRASPAGGTMN